MEHSAAFLKIVDDAKALIKELTIAQTRARIANDATIKLIDVREDREWTLGHISGAEHIGKGVIERDIETKIPDKSAEIILYCGGGFRSALAAETLQKMGYANVYSMDGGWREWANAGYPVDI
ncbi:MAG: sulfurtransferase [Gemmatimonadetes bacterium]|nr:MAG: sulfurtransferase [Gemmatimonadota bacterium]GDX86565.1 sulfurtransferase [Gemmatimonadota bacterium]